MSGRCSPQPDPQAELRRPGRFQLTAQSEVCTSEGKRPQEDSQDSKCHINPHQPWLWAPRRPGLTCFCTMKDTVSLRKLVTVFTSLLTRVLWLEKRGNLQSTVQWTEPPSSGVGEGGDGGAPPKQGNEPQGPRGAFTSTDRASIQGESSLRTPCLTSSSPQKSIIHLLNNYLQSSNYVPGTKLGCGRGDGLSTSSS